MPCNTITTQLVVLTKALPDVLRAGLEAAGWKVDVLSPAKLRARRGVNVIVWEAGKGLEITSQYPEAVKAKVLQHYSQAAVGWAAQRAGWTVNQAGENRLTLTRR